DLVRGNGITAVMAFTVFHIGDQILADQLLPGISFRKHLLKSIQNDVDDLDILLLIMSADIVGLEQASFLLNHIDSFGMVHYIEPVAHVFSVSVYRKLLALKRVIDDQGDQLFRKLVWSVIIAAVCDIRRELISIHIRFYQHIRGGLACGIRTVRIIGGRLIKITAVLVQGTVNFI